MSRSEKRWSFKPLCTYETPIDALVGGGESQISAPSVSLSSAPSSSAPSSSAPSSCSVISSSPTSSLLAPSQMSVRRAYANLVGLSLTVDVPRDPELVGWLRHIVNDNPVEFLQLRLGRRAQTRDSWLDLVVALVGATNHEVISVTNHEVISATNHEVISATHGTSVVRKDTARCSAFKQITFSLRTAAVRTGLGASLAARSCPQHSHHCICFAPRQYRLSFRYQSPDARSYRSHPEVCSRDKLYTTRVIPKMYCMHNRVTNVYTISSLLPTPSTPYTHTRNVPFLFPPFISLSLSL